MSSPKREFTCETCNGIQIDTLPKYTKFITENGIYECVKCRRERRKRKTLAKYNSPEEKARRRAKIYVMRTCPICGTEREIKKYCPPDQICATCASRNMGKANGKPKKPKPPKKKKKLPKLVKCVDCGDERKLIQYRTNHPKRCLTCAAKHRRKAQVEAAKIEKEKKLAQRAEAIKRKEAQKPKVTPKSEHIVGNNIRKLTEEEEKAIADFIERKGVTKIPPRFEEDPTQSGQRMHL